MIGANGKCRAVGPELLNIVKHRHLDRTRNIGSLRWYSASPPPNSAVILERKTINVAGCNSFNIRQSRNGSGNAIRVKAGRVSKLSKIVSAPTQDRTVAFQCEVVS